MKRTIKAANNAMDIKDIIISTAEELGWNVTDYSENVVAVELEYYCGNGLDGIADVSADSWENFTDALADYAFYYDPEEEALIEVQANGAPGIRAVLEDCDEFAEQLDELVAAIKSAI